MEAVNTDKDLRQTLRRDGDAFPDVSLNFHESSENPSSTNLFGDERQIFTMFVDRIKVFFVYFLETTWKMLGK